MSAKVRERGWVLSAYTMPPDAQAVRSLRVVVRPHLNHTVIDTLANDIIAACQHLEKHGGDVDRAQTARARSVRAEMLRRSRLLAN